jgi:hypothetical protein
MTRRDSMRVKEEIEERLESCQEIFKLLSKQLKDDIDLEISGIDKHNDEESVRIARKFSRFSADLMLLQTEMIVLRYVLELEELDKLPSNAYIIKDDNGEGEEK